MNTTNDFVNSTLFKQFWATFNECKTDMDRIVCLEMGKVNNYPYDKEELEIMLDPFCSCTCDVPIHDGRYADDIPCSRTDPMIVAETFTKCYGKDCNIIESLDTMCDDDINLHTVRELIVAFIKLGHKRD